MIIKRCESYWPDSDIGRSGLDLDLVKYENPALRADLKLC